jgi:putative cardiolipin synthase
VGQVVRKEIPEARALIDAGLAEFSAGPDADRYLGAVAANRFVPDLLDGRLPIEWVPATLVSDDPAKGLGRAPDSATTGARLREVIGNANSSLNIVSPYFVPMRAGTDALDGLERSGVQVQIYELQRLDTGADGRPTGPLTQRVGSAGAALHAKTFAVDGRRVYVGSFNFDPRSAIHNTELGVVLESPQLAAQVDSLFATQLGNSAYTVTLVDDRLQWQAVEGDSLRQWRHEPKVSVWRRAWLRVLRLLPLDWLV